MSASGPAWIPAGREIPKLPGQPDPTLTGQVLVLDVSGSMSTCDDSSERRRIDRLRDVLQDTMRDAPAPRVAIFGDQVRELTGLEPGPALVLPGPSGGTPLHLALELVGTWSPRPARVVVISDGRPDDPTAALAAARALKPAVISALYIGPDGDQRALSFMRTLALMGGRGGISGHRSLAGPEAAKTLAAEVRLLLAGPGR